MRHKFMLVTVKEWLKSALNYRSYPQNKTGYPFFGPPCRLNSTASYLFVTYLLRNFVNYNLHYFTTWKQRLEKIEMCRKTCYWSYSDV